MVVRVVLPTKRVEVWDSMGPSTETQKYMTNIFHYVYDTLTLIRED